MIFKHQLALYSTIIVIISSLIAYQLSRQSLVKTKPLIVCTTTIIADTIKNIGKDSFDVVSLMGPGTDPHLYKPVESDVIKIASADIIFYNGLHLEAKMADLFEHLAQKKITVAVTKDIPKNLLIPIDNYNHIFDPHVWFDINLWCYAVQTISQCLQENYPDLSDDINKNSQNYIQELTKLLDQTYMMMKTIPQERRILITGHDAFSYFGRLYNCRVIGLQGISTESSPGAYDLAQIIQIICDHKIPAIFIESSIPIKNIIAIEEGVAACNKQVKIGGQLYSDALDTPTGAGNNYINMIRYNVQTITYALH